MPLNLAFLESRYAKLLCKNAYARSGVLMKLRSSGCARHRQAVLFLLLTLFTVTGITLAQQPSNASPTVEQAQPSAAIPAAQPVQSPTIPPALAATNPAKPEDSTKGQSEDFATRLGSGDLIEVSVYNVPELTTKARISNSGDIYLPLVDYVHVDGMTQEEAQALIEKRLSDGGFVRSPHVSIFVDDATSQGVTVLGEVAKAGIYPVVGDHKLYEIISEAGGFTQSAAHKVSILHRNATEPLTLTLPRNLADDPSANIEVVPGDTITVPRAPIIYIVGDVARPSGLLVDNGTLTVLQALALAGGTNHTAKLSAARIIRKGSNGMTETKIQIKKMLEAKAPDEVLKADDILFIPVSGAKVIAGRTLDVATQAATAVSLYAIHP
jgi:polysaccharide biosynthesis/export protein